METDLNQRLDKRGPQRIREREGVKGEGGKGKEVKKARIRERGNEKTRKTREDRERAVSLKHRSKRGPPHYVGYNRGPLK